jgi:acyl-CoA synthetase (NDP forming)
VTASQGPRSHPSGERPSLERLLRPKSIAIVGATDEAVRARTVASVLDLDVDAFIVNPRRPNVFGRPTVASLSSIGRPVDVVFSLLSAAATVQVAEEAADLGAGGLVVVASGFAEMGGDGEELQRRLAGAAARGGMPVVGPNGVGYINVVGGVELTFLPRFDRRPGGVSVVAHSGALLEAFAAAAWRSGGVGLNLLISAGNEAVTDLADYLDYLVDDPDTTVIVLALEKVRRPEAFFAAAARARRAGKPVFAIKMGRSERSLAMARSHTGTITTNSWVYEIGFRQAGITVAGDVDEVIDRIQFLEQLSPEKWSPVRALAVLTGTGGFASLTVDLAAEESVDVPDVPRLNDWIGEVVPGAQVANPLDATGFVVGQPEIWDRVLAEYASAPEFDAFVYLSQFAEWDLRSKRFSDSFVESFRQAGKPCFVSPLAGHAAQWVDEYREQHGAGVGNGIRGTLRGLAAMGAYVRSRPDAEVRAPASVPPLPRPHAGWVNSEAGPMLSFAAAMELLRSHGIPVAPYHVIAAGADPGSAAVPFAGPYVVKLADVAHRTELGAVLLDVPGEELAAAVDQLRAIAARQSVPADVAVQPRLAGHGEAFVGLAGRSELGPVLTFGMGGTLVEVIGQLGGLGGKLAPLAEADARDLISECDRFGIMDGFRGAPAWDRAQLAQLLVAAGQLIAAGRDWIETMDINPLIVTAGGAVAVDAACFPALPSRPG